MSTYKGFSKVQLRKPQRSLFDLSHEKKLSTRMGRLTPVFISETMPNDTFRCNTEILLRLAPMIAPIMHRVNVFVHYFFVPNRLLWEDWELFITNGRLGTETPPVPPNAYIGEILGLGGDYLDEKSLADYLGHGTVGDAAAATFEGIPVDLMPWAAYYKCWYDYYRDRNYIADDENLPLPSGNITASPLGTVEALMRLRNRDWQKDYFTSALPWTQRGNEVLMPLIGTGTVTYLDNSLVKKEDGSVIGAGDVGNLDFSATSVLEAPLSSSGANNPDLRIENIDEVNLESSEVSINDLRMAVRLQEWMERQALAGSRYNETIWAHFNRRTSDGRLQRAEYLGGGKVTVRISEVMTTAFSTDSEDAIVPPANPSGRGFVMDGTPSFSYNCEEHGFVIGIMSVMPNLAYVSGSQRMFHARRTFLDYPWPSFAHLGEQLVKKYELWTSPEVFEPEGSAPPENIDFGYQSRYSDWKWIRSSAHGDFRSTLDHWHLNIKFASTPSLGATFVGFPDALQDRVFAVSGVDTLWCYIYNKCSVKRSLPYFGTPLL